MPLTESLPQPVTVSVARTVLPGRTRQASAWAHAGQELAHALTIAKHIDYLGGMPTATPQPVKLSEDPKVMLRADLANENATIVNYRQRVKQCEELGEYAIAEDIREILRQEQEHQSDLANALGEDVPDVSKLPKK